MILFFGELSPVGGRVVGRCCLASSSSFWLCCFAPLICWVVLLCPSLSRSGVFPLVPYGLVLKEEESSTITKEEAPKQPHPQGRGKQHYGKGGDHSTELK